jgi:RNA polymerase-binding protein DksA
MVEAENIFEDLDKFDGFYTDDELTKFAEIVSEKFEETRRNLKRSIEKVRSTTMEESGNTSHSLHMADQGTDAMEREKAFLFAQRDEKYLIQIEKAQERIKAGTFGICKTCGIKITPARLHAVPTTAICISCKSAKEKR